MAQSGAPGGTNISVWTTPPFRVKSKITPERWSKIFSPARYAAAAVALRP